MERCFFLGFIKILVLFHLIGTLPEVNGIIGGFWKSIRNHPYLVCVAYEVPIPCGGTIIMSSWILTAAKCIHHGHVGVHGVLGIKIGITNFDKDKGILVRKKSLHVHPHFLSEPHMGMAVNDIGLIQLEKHLEFGPHVHPIGVAFQAVKQNASCLTMGWGLINPNVYLTGKIHDPAFWPKKGENTLRDIEQQINVQKPLANWDDTKDEPLWECKRLIRQPYRLAIHQDWHICALHYTFAADPYNDPTAPTWDKPGRKRAFDNKKILMDINSTRFCSSIDKKCKFANFEKWKPKFRNKRLKRQYTWHYYHHYYQDNYPEWTQVGLNWYWSAGYKVLRVVTDGPSFFDYGGPLLCYGQQVGVFSFPVSNVQMRHRYHYTRVWPPAARAVYTLLLRYVPWIDTVIEIEINKEENNPPAKPDDTVQYNIWDDLSKAPKKYFADQKIIFLTIFVVYFFLN